MRVALTLAWLSLASGAGAPNSRVVTTGELRDRIRGGWAGQMIGVVYGAPVEHYWLGTWALTDPPAWDGAKLVQALAQDDLYIDVLFLAVLDRKGPSAGTADFGDALRNARRPLAHGNLAARRLLRRGVAASDSGKPEFNPHWEDIDFQIGADFIGLMAPGMPRVAQALAQRVGPVIGGGEGLLGGVFIACMYSAALVESNPEAVVHAGLACLPASSRYYRTVAAVAASAKRNPHDWKRAWMELKQQAGETDRCPAGALRVFNIDAPFSGALVALALLYGNGDFDHTLDVAVRAGYDADCTAASAGGVLGAILGFKRIPKKWTAHFPEISQQKFLHSEYTLDAAVESTLRQAQENLRRAGVSVTGGKPMVLPKQEPATLPFLAGPADYPVERISVADSRWRWSGHWETSFHVSKYTPVQTKTASHSGAEASITFFGTGAIISGPLLSGGGKADVYLNGKFDRSLDVCSDENRDRLGEAVWRRLGLPPGEHTVRLVVRGEPHPPCRDSRVAIDDLIVFTSGR